MLSFTLYLQRAGSLDAVEEHLARYITVYTVWTTFMVFVVPFIYRY